MPRPLLSQLDRIQRSAQRLLLDLRKDIQAKEAELRRLKDEESKLHALAGPATVRVARGRAKRGGRINWRALLVNLPKQFKASDIRSLRGLKNRRASEIFAGITRWMDAGLIRRKSRGLYVRVQQAHEVKSQKAA
jgi:hypothetical protein